MNDPTKFIELLKQAASEETDEDIFYQDKENEDKDFDVYTSYDCKEQAYYAGLHRGRTELAREVLEAFRQYSKV